MRKYENTENNFSSSAWTLVPGVTHHHSSRFHATSCIHLPCRAALRRGSQSASCLPRVDAKLTKTVWPNSVHSSTGVATVFTFSPVFQLVPANLLFIISAIKPTSCKLQGFYPDRQHVLQTHPHMVSLPCTQLLQCQLRLGFLLSSTQRLCSYPRSPDPRHSSHTDLSSPSGKSGSTIKEDIETMTIVRFPFTPVIAFTVPLYRTDACMFTTCNISLVLSFLQLRCYLRILLSVLFPLEKVIWKDK